MHNQVEGVIYYTILPTTEALGYGLGAAGAALTISEAIAASKALGRLGVRAFGARATVRPVVVPIGGLGLAF